MSSDCVDRSRRVTYQGYAAPRDRTKTRQRSHISLFLARRNCAHELSGERGEPWQGLFEPEVRIARKRGDANFLLSGRRHNYLTAISPIYFHDVCPRTDLKVP